MPILQRNFLSASDSPGSGTRAIAVGKTTSAHVMCAPRVSTYTAYNDELPVMNNRLRFVPPKQTLLQISGNRTWPMRTPSGAKI